MSDGYHYTCLECSKIQKNKYKAENKQKIKEAASVYYVNNKEKINKRNREWKINNPEKVSLLSKNLYIKNKDEILLNQKKYRKMNKPRLAAKAAKERAVRGLASPKWLTNTQKMQIEWFYQAAKMMTETSGKIHHVDHIHPLQGENFNGLHVPWNLRVIPAEENIRKSNKLVGV